MCQEALDMRHRDMESLHLAHTVVESAATLLIVLLQMLHTRTGVAKVRRPSPQQLRNYKKT